MRAWVAQQDWLTLERLPAYGPELNPVEMLWSSLKKRELANLAGEHLADVADATEQGIHRIIQNRQLPWSFLSHTGLTIHPPTPTVHCPRLADPRPGRRNPARGPDVRAVHDDGPTASWATRRMTRTSCGVSCDAAGSCR
ncbi:transposase [Streptomyces sp. NPDC001739]